MLLARVTDFALNLQVEILKTQLANEQVARDLVTQQFRAASSEKRKLHKQVSIQEKTIINLKADIDEQTVQLIGALKDKDRLYSTSKVPPSSSFRPAVWRGSVFFGEGTNCNQV